MNEEGTLMEHGKFSFDSTEEVPKDTQLEARLLRLIEPAPLGVIQARSRSTAVTANPILTTRFSPDSNRS